MDQNDNQFDIYENEVDPSMDMNDVYQTDSRDLCGLYDTGSQLSSIPEHDISASEPISIGEPRILQQGQASSGVWLPIAHNPPLFDSSVLP